MQAIFDRQLTKTSIIAQSNDLNLKDIPIPVIQAVITFHSLKRRTY